MSDGKIRMYADEVENVGTVQCMVRNVSGVATIQEIDGQISWLEHPLG